MATDRQHLTPDMEQTVQQHGGRAEFDGQQGAYIVMTMDLYQAMVGPDFEASIKAIQQGLADVEAGRTQPAEEFFAELRQT